MKWIDAILILAIALLALFLESAFGTGRRFLGAQLHLLPSLMVYTALRAGFGTISALALIGGLFSDALSANPLGVSVLPLLAVGVAIFARRDLILQSQFFARAVLGVGASVVAPALTILLLLTMSQSPLLGWGTLWQFLVMAAAGALAAPGFFLLFEWIERTFMYGRTASASFRPDREIRRGRI